MSMYLPSLTDDYDGISKKTIKPRIWGINVTTKDNRHHLILLEKNICDEKNKLSITYRLVDQFNIGAHGGRGEFRASYNKSSNSLSLTGGAIFLDLAGLEGNRIGSYIMNEVISWAKQWPDATIDTIHLTNGQAEPENKKRRNKFYEQFGLVFHYESDEQEAGYSLDTKACKLNNINTWTENIKELNIIELIGLQQDKINNLNYSLEFIKNDLTDIRNNLGKEYLRKIIYKIRRYLPI